MLINEAVKLEKAVKAFANGDNGDKLKELFMQYGPTAYSNDYGEFAGKYYTWLGNQYMNGNLSPENLKYVRPALEVYNKNSKEIGVHINQIQNVSQLIELVTPYTNQNANKQRDVKRSIQDLETVYEDQYFTIYIPHTYEASRQIGGDTTWCTASSSSKPFYYYQTLYGGGGDLYVIVRKDDPSKKFQYFDGLKELRNRKDIEAKFQDLGTIEEVSGVIRFLQSRGFDLSKFM